MDGDKVDSYEKIPMGYWKNPDNHLLWFEDFRRHYELTTFESLYTINQKMIRDFNGITLVKEYYKSIINLVKSLYPEYEWKSYKFPRRANGYWEIERHRIEWFEDFRKHYNLGSYNSLYDINSKMIDDYYGKTLRNNYYKSIFIMVQSLCPEFEWKFYKFRYLKGHWGEIENQKLWFEDLRDFYGLTTVEDIYSLNLRMITDFYGITLVKEYYGSILNMVESICPEYEWKFYKFRGSKGYWSDLENQRIWFEDLRENYNLTTSESLYQINSKMINEFYGGNIWNFYSKIPELVMALCPNHDWKFYRFRGSQGHWSDIENQKLWFNDLREHYGFDSNEDLYDLTVSKISDFYGITCVVALYDGSPSELVRALIPEYDWKIYKFSNTPQGYWDDRKNLQSWFEDMRRHYGFNKNEDLYNINLKMILDFHGRTPISKFNDSKINLIRHLIPEFDWKEYKFVQTRKNYWDDIENQKSWFRDFREHYGLDTYESLYDVSSKMISDYYGSGLLTRTKTNYGGSPSLFVPTMCPEYDWDLSKFASNRKTQKSLFKILKQKFPDAIWEYRTEVRWDFRNKIGYDIFVPSMNLAFEGQGHQHYIPIEMWGGSDALTKQKQRDEQKSDLAQELGIRLVIVPFCDLDPELPKWQSSWESLVEICKLQGINLSLNAL